MLNNREIKISKINLVGKLQNKIRLVSLNKFQVTESERGEREREREMEMGEPRH